MDQNVTQKNNGEEEEQHRLKTKMSHDTSERGKLERQTDRQTDRHTDGQIDKQTDRDGNGGMAGRISPV